MARSFAARHWLLGWVLVAGLQAAEAAASHELDGVVEISLLGAFPSGEYGDAVDGAGAGVDAMIGGRVGDVLQLGLQLGWSRFGQAIVEDFDGRLGEIADNTFMSHVVLRVQPRFGRVRPYVEGLLGTRALFTTGSTGLLGEPYLDGSEWVASYGLGAGLGVRLLGGAEGPQLSLSAGLRHLWGGQATHLVVRDRHPDPIFELRRSRTDVWQPRIGLSVAF